MALRQQALFQADGHTFHAFLTKIFTLTHEGSRHPHQGIAPKNAPSRRVAATDATGDLSGSLHVVAGTFTNQRHNRCQNWKYLSCNYIDTPSYFIGTFAAET
jgi:hypothetical protein